MLKIRKYFYIKNKKGGTIMKKMLSFALAAIALVASTAACTGCTWVLADEPKALKNMD